MKKLSFLLLAGLLIGCGGGGSGGGDTSQGSGGTPIAIVSAPSLVSQTGATLNGNVNPNGLVTQAWFEYGTDPALSTFTTTAMQFIGDGSSDVPLTQSISGCTGGSVYYFRVCGINGNGTTKSTITNFTTSSLGANPTVTSLVATSVAATSATLNGNVTPNGLATTAWFEWSTAPALTTYTTTPVQSVGSEMTSLLVNAALSGLSTGTTYYCRIAASNGSGTSKGTIVSFTPGAVPTVTTLSATSVAATSATLNGTVTPNGLVTNAWFEWGTNSALSTFTSTSSQSVGSGTTSQPVNFALTGLTNGTTYYYRVAASNSSGTSKGSILSFVPGSASLISVNIITPASGALVGTNFDLAVSVTSQYQQAGVMVRIDNGPEQPLTFSTSAYCNKYGCYPGWLATISLDGLSKGNHSLLVTATDIFGNGATASRIVTYDQKPILSVSEPLNYTVARPAIHVTATCTDDDPAGCESIRADVGGTVLAMGKDSLDQDVSLATWDGTAQQLCVTARDYANQETQDCRTVYVESSPRLQEVAIFDGKIYDVTARKVLYQKGSALRIVDNATSDLADIIIDRVVSDPAYPREGSTFISPEGAIWIDVPGNVLTARVFEWKNGAITDLGFPNSASSLKVAGKYAIWCSQPNLYLRDLEAGTTSTVSTAAGNWYNDVTADGVVAWWGMDYQIRLGSSQITFGPEWNTYPVTDGVNVVYRKHLTTGLATYLYDGISEIELAPPISGPEPQFRVSNGYVAFTNQVVGGAIQVYLRSQAGTRQVSIFGTDSSPETLGPDGSLTFINQNARYLDSSTNKVGSGLGRAVQIGGSWHIVIGRSVFSVN